jgi:hypothetical protein
MRDRFSGSMITAAVAAATVSAVFSVSISGTSAQAPAVSATAVPAQKTPWGDPDLQGIWTDEFDTPLQRSAKYADQEFFTEAQRAELDRVRSEILGRFATERAINGAYNAATFFSTKRTGRRTSKIVDPPNGRIPPLTAEAQKAAAADRDFRLALLQSTDTCKKMLPGCAGGKYDPMPSPRRAEAPPRYNTANINRYDGPEDGTLGNRCLTLGLPEFGGATGSFRRIGVASRATRRTGFITSRAASKEIMPSQGGCADTAWKNSPLRRDEVPDPATKDGAEALTQAEVPQDPLQ